jgi:hypothetical protein
MGSRKTNKEKLMYKKCQICGCESSEDNQVTSGPDPYEKEINGDDTEDIKAPIFDGYKCSFTKCPHLQQPHVEHVCLLYPVSELQPWSLLQQDSVGDRMRVYRCIREWGM